MKTAAERAGSLGAARPLLVLAATLAVACGGDAGYEIAINGGRVIDPESGLDAVRSVGIRDGRIETVSESELVGETTIDATGLVVAPGFIDLHVHGQTPELYDLQAMDGVTSSFELEVGTGDVDAWYADHDAVPARINYGVSVGHIPTRMAVLGDPGDFLPSGPATSEAASEEQLREMERRLEAGLDQGAVAVGFGWAYTPAATPDEMSRMMAVAGRGGAAAHIHLGGSAFEDARAALRGAMEAAARGGAALHVVHMNSSGTTLAMEMLDTIQAVRDRGRDVTTEAYPYEAGMTRIESALFDDWETWDDARFERHMWVATGERLNRESFGRYRAQGGEVIIFTNPPELVRQIASHPLTMVASDGFIVDGRGHPRSSGTFSRVLGRYVREAGSLTLSDAIAKMTLMPARRLEGRVAAMASKGRIRAGADADVVVFDPERIVDRADYMNPTAPSEGVRHVFVGGVPVVRAGLLVEGAAPGQPIRAPREGGADGTDQ